MSQGEGRNNEQSALSPKQLDQLFREAERNVNSQVIGQQLFVEDLVAGYKQGYMSGRQNYKARNVILLAGAAGTGKKTALEWLIREMHTYRLTSRPHIAEIDLRRYEPDEISGVQQWIDKELTVVLSGLRARNEIRRNESVRIRGIA